MSGLARECLWESMLSDEIVYVETDDGMNLDLPSMALVQRSSGIALSFQSWPTSTRRFAASRSSGSLYFVTCSCTLGDPRKPV
jgi:hypothetical protein